MTGDEQTFAIIGAAMSVHRGRIHAVMVGVGAAFDYHAGTCVYPSLRT